MKVNVDQPYTLAALKPKLEAAFPEYNVSFRGPKVLVVSNGKLAAVQIVGEKKTHARLFEAFPTFGAQMLFFLIVIVGGIIIPFGIFLLAIKPKQIMVRDTVANFIRKEYGSGATGATKETADLLDATV